MRANSLEEIIPGLREAREAERLNRAMVFGGVNWTLCGQEVVALTPRHRLEFQLTGNAFSAGRPAQAADIFAFLWRLNPRFKRKVWFGSRAHWEKCKLLHMVQCMNIPTAERLIYEFVRSMLQDLPEGNTDRASINPPEQYVHVLASEAHFYMTRYASFTLRAYMDTPYLVLQQLYRAHRLEQEQHPQFINESDRLVGIWQRQHMPKREAKTDAN